MLKKLKQSKSEGFTIIEVMIVLAIAGLIILIVLLAVPALQRNGRNTAIKNDAAAITAGIAEYSSNNDGQIPSQGSSDATTTPGTITLLRGGGTASQAKVQASTTVTIRPDSTNTAVTPEPGTLIVTFGTRCPDPVPTTNVAVTDSVRSTSVIYAIETSNGRSARCLDS
jgi:prepilin-type N-terminal cleavage/methylation domain-containing protein